MNTTELMPTVLRTNIQILFPPTNQILSLSNQSNPQPLQPIKSSASPTNQILCLSNQSNPQPLQPIKSSASPTNQILSLSNQSNPLPLQPIKIRKIIAIELSPNLTTATGSSNLSHTVLS